MRGVVRNLRIACDHRGLTRFGGAGLFTNILQVLQHSAPPVEDPSRAETGPSYSQAFRSSYSSIKRHGSLISSAWMRRLLHVFINFRTIAPSCNCPSNPVWTALGGHPQAYAAGCFRAAIGRFTPDPSDSCQQPGGSTENRTLLCRVRADCFTFKALNPNLASSAGFEPAIF